MFVLNYILSCEGCFGVCSECLNYYIQGIAGSLTNRYVKDMWETWIKRFRIRKEVLQKVGIPLEDIKESFYTKWIWGITLSINNNMIQGNGLTLWKMLEENRKILRSSECRVAFKYGEFKEFNRLYTPVLKTRSALLVWLFHKLVEFKHKLRP